MSINFLLQKKYCCKRKEEVSIIEHYFYIPETEWKTLLKETCVYADECTGSDCKYSDGAYDYVIS